MKTQAQRTNAGPSYDTPVPELDAPDDVLTPLEPLGVAVALELPSSPEVVVVELPELPELPELLVDVVDELAEATVGL